MKTLEQLTKDELSLLLYFETCAVDRSGKVESLRMNDTDRTNAERWNKEGFVQYGRIAAKSLTEYGSHWCHLSDEAWKLVAEARKARADRQWNARNYQTTAEKRAA